MNNNYLKYNNLGILVDSQLEEVSQGNHNVDYYYIAYDVYDYTNSFVTVSVTLPDGTSLPELATSPKDFQFEGNTYKGFVFVLRDTLTSQSGNLSMTFNLKSVENDTQLCSSRLNVPIHETDVSTSPTITQEQYDQMQEVIRENTVKSNEALEKANDALYHDATIVKVNGEVQQTWDATISQKISEESLNELKITNQNTTLSNTNIQLTDEILTVNGSPTGAINHYFWDNNNNIIGKRKVKLFHKGGSTTATIQVIVRRDGNNIYNFYFNGSAFDGSNIAEIEFQGNERLFLYFGGNRTATNLQLGLTISKYEMGEFYSYNSNKHITNEEADFLKNEYEKSKNEFYITQNVTDTHLGTTIKYNKENQTISLNGTATQNFNRGAIKIKPIKLKKGETVTLSVDGYDSSNRTGYAICVFSSAEGFWGSNILFRSLNTDINYVVKTVNADVTLDCVGIYAESGASYSSEKSFKIQVEKGSVATSYQAYNGAILHPKDIDSVTLWENASPNATFNSSSNEILFDATKYKYIDIYSKNILYSDQAPVRTRVKYNGGTAIGYLIMIAGDSGNIYKSRKFTIKPTGIDFSDNFSNGTVNNDSNVPVTVCGSNY